jgi:hypothetical protein
MLKLLETNTGKISALARSFTIIFKQNRIMRDIPLKRKFKKRLWKDWSIPVVYKNGQLKERKKIKSLHDHSRQ